MADNKDKIIRYVTGNMDEEEEILFEAEMEADEDLRLQVQLEQISLANIHRRVTAALENDDLNETAGPEERSRPDAQGLQPGWRLFLQQLKTGGLWQRLAVVALLLGLALGLVWWLRQSPKSERTGSGQSLEIQPGNQQVIPSSAPATPNDSLKTRHTTPGTPARPAKPDSFYLRIALRFQDTLKTGGPSAGAQAPTEPPPNTFARAYSDFRAGRYDAVHAFTRTRPTDDRAIQLEGYALFNEHKFAEAALVFSKLPGDGGFGKKAEWMILLCHVGRYNTHRADFKKLAAAIRLKGHHLDQLDQLEKAIAQ